MKSNFFWATSFVFLVVVGQARAQEIGKPAPEMLFTKVLNDKDSTYKLSDFKGKAVMIDYWATWCRPCVEGFPTLEAHQKEFAQDLKVITISDDSEKRLKTFLEKTKTSLPIAVDSKNVLGKAFPHSEIPHTIWIDAQGIVRAIANPSDIKKSTLQDLIAGKPIDVKEKKDELEFNPDTYYLGNPNAVGQITVTNYRKEIPSVQKYKNGRLLFLNFMPSTMYEMLYDFPTLTRSVWETDKKKYGWTNANLYCAEIIAPNKTEEEAKKMLLQYLQTTLPLKVRKEKREMPIKILRKTGKVALEVAKPEDEKIVTPYGKMFEIRNSPIAPLVTFLEEKYGAIIVDETGLKENYNLRLSWHYENPKKFLEDLNKMGFELTDAKRTVDVLVFYE